VAEAIEGFDRQPVVGPGRPGAVALSRVVRVVPDVPSFAVDDGVAYAVPEGMDVEVGAVVRVPLGGRRLRGWVVAVGEPPRPRLRPILARSGDLPVFDAALLGVLRWAAIHYVAPLAAVLAKATPPNLPRGVRAPVPARAGHRRARLLVGPGPGYEAIAAAIAPVAAAGRSTIVVAATVPEAEATAAALSARLGIEVPAVSSQRGGAAASGVVRLATEPGWWWRTLNWRRADGCPGLAVLVGGSPRMKDKATPTIHARDLLLRRAAAERFSVVMTELVPTAEALSRSGSVEAMGRPWGLVDLVDRRPDQPGSGLIAAATAAALRAVGGRRVLLFTHRRTAAQRCVRCQALRRCQSCGRHRGMRDLSRCGAATGLPSCGGRRFEALGRRRRRASGGGPNRAPGARSGWRDPAVSSSSAPSGTCRGCRWISR
jgi:primosomal protein N' (replication factor Y)